MIHSPLKALLAQVFNLSAQEVIVVVEVIVIVVSVTVVVVVAVVVVVVVDVEFWQSDPK